MLKRKTRKPKSKSTAPKKRKEKRKKMDREALEKEAQKKLSDARALIKEAGELAKKGQFFLHFGEIGSFIPKSAMSRSGLREQALKIAMEEGLTTKDATYDWSKRDSNGNILELTPREFMPWDDLDESQREQLVEEITDGLWDDSPVPWEFRQYCSESDADCWWHPSRC